MLVVTRKTGERVAIGPADKPYGYVTLVRSKDGQASLGFDFPREIEVHRDEIVQRIKRESENID